MSIKKLLSISLICIGFAAAAHGQIVSMAYEIALSEFQAPTTANSSVAFRECRDCERKRVRVTPTTRYAVNGEQVRLEDFRKAVQQADDDDTSVTVLHHLESNTVEALDVWF